MNYSKTIPESCFVDQISLAGLKSSRGREIVQGYGALSFVDGYIQVLPANGRRASAILQNLDDIAVILVVFGPVWGAPYPLYIYPHGVLQIDTDFPWNGEVYATVSSGSGNIAVTEVSVL